MACLIFAQCPKKWAEPDTAQVTPSDAAADDRAESIAVLWETGSSAIGASRAVRRQLGADRLLEAAPLGARLPDECARHRGRRRSQRTALPPRRAREAPRLRRPERPHAPPRLADR